MQHVHMVSLLLNRNRKSFKAFSVPPVPGCLKSQTKMAHPLRVSCLLSSSLVIMIYRFKLSAYVPKDQFLHGLGLQSCFTSVGLRYIPRTKDFPPRPRVKIIYV